MTQKRSESPRTPQQQEHSRLTWVLRVAWPILRRWLCGLRRCRPGVWRARGGCECLVVCWCLHRGRPQRQALLRVRSRGPDINVLLPRPGLQAPNAVAGCLHECTEDTLHTILLCLQ